MRMVHEVSEDGIVTHFALPGGVNERMDSKHFLDLFELWRSGETMILSPDWEDVEAAGIERMTAFVPEEPEPEGSE